VQLACSRPVSKYELLQLTADVWDRCIDIRPVATSEAVDRTLVADVPCPSIGTQLVELRRWYEARFGTVPFAEALW
jgi:hypothetical protein